MFAGILLALVLSTLLFGIVLLVIEAGGHSFLYLLVGLAVTAAVAPLGILIGGLISIRSVSSLEKINQDANVIVKIKKRFSIGVGMWLVVFLFLLPKIILKLISLANAYQQMYSS